MIGMSGLHK